MSKLNFVLLSMILGAICLLGFGCSGSGDDNGNGPSTAELYVSVDYIYFDATDIVQNFYIQNYGVDDLHWNISIDETWITCSLLSGELVSNDSILIFITVNRSGLSVGTYTTNINISSNGGTHIIELTMIVEGGGSSDMFVSVDTLDFGETETDITFFIQNDGSTDISWTLSDNVNWLSVAPNNGVLAAPFGLDSITAIVDRAGLPVGSFEATITITSTVGSETVHVMISVPCTAELFVSEDDIYFEISDTASDFFVRNDGDDDLIWSLSVSESWLSCNPTSGSLVTYDYEYIEITVNRTGLNAGTYYADINIVSNGGNHTIEVTMIVRGGVFTDLFVSVSSLNFGQTDTDLSFFIQNDGTTDIFWTLADDASWLSVNTTNGLLIPNDSETLIATVDRTGLSSGYYNAVITIASSQGIETVDVIMAVTTLIYTDNFTYADNTDFDVNWSCGDNEPTSDLVYWGMVDWDNTMDIEAPLSGDGKYVHCAGRNGYAGSFYEYYENDMDAYMLMNNSLDLSGYTDLSIKFNWAYETESDYDYVQVYAGNSTSGWNQHASGYFDDGDWTWQTDEIALSNYSLSSSQLANFSVKIVFYSDYSMSYYHGSAIDKMEIWGTAITQ